MHKYTNLFFYVVLLLYISNKLRDMNKETIMNNYAIEQGVDNWSELVEYSEVLEYHINKVTDLIQEELLKKASKQLILGQTLNKAQQSILNTEIL